MAAHGSSKQSRKRVTRLVILAALCTIIGTGVWIGTFGSSENQAKRHFERGTAFAQSGDDDRAILEFRNVFKKDPTNLDARVAMAEVFERKQDLGNALGHYLYVVEKQTENVEVQKKVALLASRIDDWPLANSYAKKVLASGEQDETYKAIELASGYALAIRNNRRDERQTIAAEALALSERLPDNLLLKRVETDNKVFQKDFVGALKAVEAGRKIAPNDVGFLELHLRVLSTLGEWETFEQELSNFVEVTPNNRKYENALLQFYMSRDRKDDAENLLRAQVNRVDDKNTAQVRLIEFIARTKGTKAAEETVSQFISERPDDLTLKGLKAGFTYENGSREEGIAELKALVEKSEDDEEKNRFKVALARMNVGIKDEKAARELIKEVLEVDSSNSEAAKLEGHWLIDEDKSTEAISLLREAVSSAENDANLLTLLARAYARDGKSDLSGDMLARAAEVSNYAPEPSLRYAQFLARSGKYIPAERVLIDSLRSAGKDEKVSAALGRIYIQIKDFPRAEQVAKELEAMDTEFATTRSREIKVALLAAQNSSGEAAAYLENLANQSGGAQSRFELVRLHLANGKPEQALEALQPLLDEAPDNPQILYVKGMAQASTGDLRASEKTFRDVLEKEPKAVRVWLTLMRQFRVEGRNDEIATLLEEAIEANPEAPDLLWAKASQLESVGNIDGAIGVYEKLYDKNSNNVVVANNLASLISTHRKSEAGVDRAFNIAKRLKDAKNPAFQDTYGWLLHLKGRSKEALPYLDASAQALPNEPSVQFHHATVLEALGDKENALNGFLKVLSLSSNISAKPFLDEAREKVDALKLNLATETQSE